MTIFWDNHIDGDVAQKNEKSISHNHFVNGWDQEEKSVKERKDERSVRCWDVKRLHGIWPCGFLRVSCRETCISSRSENGYGIKRSPIYCRFYSNTPLFASRYQLYSPPVLRLYLLRCSSTADSGKKKRTREKICEIAWPCAPYCRYDAIFKVFQAFVGGGRGGAKIPCPFSRWES